MNTTVTDRLLRHATRIERAERDSDSGRMLSHASAVLDEVQVLESAASAWREGELDPEVLGCFAATLNSLATVSLLLDRNRAPAGDPGSSQLLYAINQNLRFAADAAERAGDALADRAS